MTAKKWFFVFSVEVFVLSIAVSLTVIVVDPYFHYHKPISSMFYTLDNQRSQNDGIIKQFNYDSIITGTSMAENFKSSEFDEIFHAKSVKVCFSGGSYKEINDLLKKACDLRRGEIKYVLRCLDYGYLLTYKDDMRTDLGEYPIYLYDNNPFNDVKYILNKEIICDICIPMIIKKDPETRGVTSFDEYSNWMKYHTFGKKEVLGDRQEFSKSGKIEYFTESDRAIVKGTIDQNVISLAKEYPDITFYYYFSPYSIAYWGTLFESGTLNKQIEAERYAIEQILKCKNIKLYSFNNFWNITTNLDNYKDYVHYGEWINSEILFMIHNGIGQLTEENYEEYIEEEKEFYLNYNYQFFQK